MKTLNIVQGSPEWHQHRATAFNASDAPAMLGLSKYKTRNQLLHERATGIIPEVDAATQQRFNDGHRYEALARPLAEEIIGDTLSPVTGLSDECSASFDGITFDESIIFEHKSLNNEIRTALGDNGNTGALDAMYRVQMEHQLMVSGAEKCFFMASKWDGDSLAEKVHGWYLPDLVLRKRISLGWAQFKKDLAAYVPPIAVAKPVAETIMELPSLSVQATGMVTQSNLPAFKAAAQSYIDNINTNLQTDTDFANAEATVKFCKATEEKLEATKAAILAQTASIDEVISTVSFIQKQLAEKRLMLDKLVKSEKVARKNTMAATSNVKYAEHVASLQNEIAGIRLHLLLKAPDFGASISGLKSLESMQNALDTALSHGIIAADATAKDVRDKLTWCKDEAAGMSMLFPDLQSIIGMDAEAFKAVIKNRIHDHQKAEADKAEALRVKIQREEEAKARVKVEAEARAKADELMPTVPTIAEDRASTSNKPPEEKNYHIANAGKMMSKPPRPGHDELIQFVADHFNVSFGTLIQFVADHFNVSFGTACDRMIEAVKSMKEAA